MTPKHGEAFSLMQYQDENDPEGPIEWLWNSRDGVSPFIIGAREGEGLLRHTNWQDDIYAPQYVPNIGQRVFIDMTREAAERYLRNKIDRQWDKDEEMRDRWGSKVDAFEKLLERMLLEVERRAPDIAVVSLAMQRQFVAEREIRRAALKEEPLILAPELQ